MENIILIDLSYFIFYRYFALLSWWNLARPDDELGVPNENPEFVEKFKKTFIEKIEEIPKKLKLKLKNSVLIGAKDCPRQEIWRNKIFNNYKEQRVYDDSFMGGPFFKLAYEELMASVCPFVEFPNLEADDCIALTTKSFRKEYPHVEIYIIANDMDYLQLADEKTHIINLKYKNLQESKNSTGNNEQDLFCKILIGDKSDNIPGIFNKCGMKTAMKYYNDRELFEKMLKKENAYENYERNKKIIDFNEIPIELQEKFINTLNLV